jgi:RNA polymerase sporulation-specific sigma factor
MLIKQIYSLLCELFQFKKDQDGVYYINGADELPPPLTPEEEKEITVQLAAGSEDSHLLRNKLIEHNLRLVVFLAKKFDNTGVGTEDLVSIGTIGLMKAVSSFDPTKNIKLATYASKCIENEILMFLRKTAPLKREISIDEPMNVDWDGNELSLADVLGTNGDEIEEKLEAEEEKTLILRAVKSLNSRDKTIIMLRFGLCTDREYTQKEVADILGISQSYISRLEKRILQKLKQELLSS